MNFPSGARIFFNAPNPQTNTLTIDDVLEARKGELCAYNQYLLYDASDRVIRQVNFTHVLTIMPLTTVGPSDAQH